MLHLHWKTIAQLATHRDLKYLVRDYFSLPKSQALMPALLAKRLGQADLVLCLLRLRDQHWGMRTQFESHITSLVGHPIHYGPTCLQSYRTGPTRIVRSKDERRITFVSTTNPRQPGTEAHLRWCEYRVGRTVGQLLVRGVTKRDIRKAIESGWIKVEQEVHA